MFDRSEMISRWGRVRALMARRDLDALIAIDASRDEILQGCQRWLTGFAPMGGPAAALLHADGVELITDRIGRRVCEYLEKYEIPIACVEGYSTALLAERVARLGCKRLGVAEPESFSAALAAAIAQSTPDVELVDVSEDLRRLRMRKSAPEIAYVRKSCAIADAIWAQAAEMFRIGRKIYEVIADVDHRVRLEGAEGGFHLVRPLPFVGRAMKSLANPERVERDARYLLEVSPRFQGYYSKLTLPITTHPQDGVARQAYDDVVAAKEAVLPLLRPGADLSVAAKGVAAFLEDRGHATSALSLGHFCGMALEETSHDPAAPCILEEGMTLVLQPALGAAAFPSLMRADTYLITASGSERLNRYDGGMLCIG